MTDYCEIEYTEKGVITKCDETHDKRAGTFILPGITVLEEFDTIESEDGRIGFGVYVPEESQIYVAGNVPQEIKLKALFHELAHWVQDISGIDFDEDTANEFAERLYNAMASEETHDKRTETHLCDYGRKETHEDLISRAEALDAIRPLQTYKLFEGDDMLLIDKADVQTELMMLPSAEPEQQWIPCSDCERKCDKWENSKI